MVRKVRRAGPAEPQAAQPETPSTPPAPPPEPIATPSAPVDLHTALQKLDGHVPESPPLVPAPPTSELKPIEHPLPLAGPSSIITNYPARKLKPRWGKDGPPEGQKFEIGVDPASGKDSTVGVLVDKETGKVVSCEYKPPSPINPDDFNPAPGLAKYGDTKVDESLYGTISIPAAVCEHKTWVTTATGTKCKDCGFEENQQPASNVQQDDPIRPDVPAEAVETLPGAQDLSKPTEDTNDPSKPWPHDF